MKDCDDMESFDRKFEKFRSKDSESGESWNGVLESFDGKFEKFRSKDTISRNDSKVDGRYHDPLSRLKLINVIFIKEVTLN